MQSHLSQDQALQVARRLSPGGVQTFRFRADGTVASPTVPLDQWISLGIEIWGCSRVLGDIHVERLA